MATAYAWAKINLTLDVLGKRPDGYHEMRTVMVSTTLRDTLRVTLGTGEGVRLRTELSYLPTDRRNLAVRAVELFQRETGLDTGGVDITLLKSIPVGAGLAGGSSDAAAVLRLLNEELRAGLSPEQLAEKSAELGADVPYCVLGGTMLAEGIGDKLTPLPPVPEMHLVLCKPRFSVSTAAAFQELDRHRIHNHPDTQGMLAAIAAGDVPGIATRVFNVFEESLARRHRDLREIRRALLDLGALGASLSGSGPTMFGIFPGEADAKRAAAQLRVDYPDTFTVQTR